MSERDRPIMSHANDVTVATPTDSADTPVVSGDTAQLYQLVLQQGFADRSASAALAAELGIAVNAVTAGFEALLSLRLLRQAPGREDVLLPVSPDVAIAELVGPMEMEIQAQQRRAGAIKSELSALHRLYFDSRRARNRREAIDVIEEVERVRTTLADIARQCTVDVFSAHPGILSEQAITDSGPHDAELLARGVRMRSIYQHPSRVHPRMRKFLGNLSQAGAEIRTCEEIPDRIVILDREVAVIPNRLGSGGAVVVREPSVVDYLYRGLEHNWSAAVPLTDGSAATHGYGAVGEDLKRAILRLLAAGAKDEHIARRLSISVRTCRRHIAELMEELQAHSRFQAGVLACASGLLGDETTLGDADWETGGDV
jgi:DNA-binding CsgD family transcriptional regulator